MKNQTLKNKLKITGALLGLSLSVGLQARASLPDYIKELNGEYQIDLYQACPEGRTTCLINIEGTPVAVTVAYGGRNNTYHHLYSVSQISSTVPILRFHTYNLHYFNRSGHLIKSQSDQPSWVILPQPMKTVLADDEYLHVGTLVIQSNGIGSYGEGFANNMLQVSQNLVDMYKTALTAVKEVSEWSYGPEVDKFRNLSKNLEQALTAIVDDKGKPRLPITHWYMIENARLVLGLSEIINEAIKPYLVGARLREQIGPYAKTLQTVSNEIRKAYGWEFGLVGTPSKTISTLSLIMSNVIKDILQNKEAMGESDLSVLKELRKSLDYLAIVGEAHEGRDAFAPTSKEFANFQSNWNSEPVQQQLSKLLNAGRDPNGLLQPKLKLLLMAVESMSSLTEARLVIPDDVAAALKASVQPPANQEKK